MTVIREPSTPSSSDTKPLEGRFVDEDPRGLVIDNDKAEGEPFDLGPADSD